MGSCETNWPSPAKCDSRPSEARPILPFCFSITNSFVGVKYAGGNPSHSGSKRTWGSCRGWPPCLPCPLIAKGNRRGIAPTERHRLISQPPPCRPLIGSVTSEKGGASTAPTWGGAYASFRRMAARGRPLRSATNLGSPMNLRQVCQILLMLRGMSGAISQMSAPPVVSRADAISIRRG